MHRETANYQTDFTQPCFSKTLKKGSSTYTLSTWTWVLLLMIDISCTCTHRALTTHTHETIKGNWCTRLWACTVRKFRMKRSWTDGAAAVIWRSCRLILNANNMHIFPCATKPNACAYNMMVVLSVQFDGISAGCTQVPETLNTLKFLNSLLKSLNLWNTKF